jgi:hypothetical protein
VLSGLRRLLCNGCCCADTLLALTFVHFHFLF